NFLLNKRDETGRGAGLLVDGQKVLGLDRFRRQSLKTSFKGRAFFWRTGPPFLGPHAYISILQKRSFRTGSRSVITSQPERIGIKIMQARDLDWWNTRSVDPAPFGIEWRNRVELATRSLPPQSLSGSQVAGLPPDLSQVRCDGRLLRKAPKFRLV